MSFQDCPAAFTLYLSRHYDSFRHYQAGGRCEESVAGGVCFRLFLDVRYNDDHTGQALLDHTNKYFDALTGLHAAHTSSAFGGIIKSPSPVGVGRTLLLPR